MLILVHKFVFHPEQLPPVFIRNNYFVFNDQVHQYRPNVRTKKDLYINNCSTTFGKRDLRFRAASLWNNLSLSLRNVSTLRLFNNKLKILLSERLQVLHCTRPMHRALSYLSFSILSVCIFCKTLLYISGLYLGGQHCWTLISLSDSLLLLFQVLCSYVYLY